MSSLTVNALLAFSSYFGLAGGEKQKEEKEEEKDRDAKYSHESKVRADMWRQAERRGG